MARMSLFSLAPIRLDSVASDFVLPTVSVGFSQKQSLALALQAVRLSGK